MGASSHVHTVCFADDQRVEDLPEEIAALLPEGQSKPKDQVWLAVHGCILLCYSL